MTSLLATASLLVDIGRGLREAFFMFWETLWALVLGFTLSGVVQAFVSREHLRQTMGDRSPAAIARASGYGMVSSSCSYAASAMSKSLFAKGADFTTSMVFMISSTNLVVELGLVMLVLLGWQFAVAEFVGGPIMIVLVALAGGMVFTPALVEAARRRLGRAADHVHGAAGVSDERVVELEHQPWGEKVRSPAAWADASAYAVADATMLRRELAIGYVVAGLLAVLVPDHVWSALFLHGHGFWTSLENALVGPLIAVVSWVCSIGNVPLAAALWGGGISFGGVIAFIFADLIAMPLILIYRKFYGWKLTLRIVLLFYVTMAVAGLATEGIFTAFGAVPANHPVGARSAGFSWNYTTWLNVLFLGIAGVVWWLARNRERFGGGQGYAIDPVCGMQVRIADEPPSAVHDGVTAWFCSDRCQERFVADPGRFLEAGAGGGAHAGHGHGEHRDDGHGHAGGGTALDPMCGMTVAPEHAAAHRTYEGADYWFCGTGCAERFDADPAAAAAARSRPG